MDEPEEELFLGIDLSTQKIKAIVTNKNLDIRGEVAVDFDRDSPEFKTQNGVHVDPRNAQRITSPVAMWLKAIDLLFERLKKSSIQVKLIKGISGCGQQHGTVYWNQEGIKRLEKLDAEATFYDQLKGGFTIANSPIWMDSSTSEECRQFEDSVGGPEKLSEITGSRAYHRFSGPQILKIVKESSEVYKETKRISLISSFVGSLLVGKVMGIEPADGSGMNLMDLRQKKWSAELISLVDQSLANKLGDLVDSNSSQNISDYLVKRYGMDPNCQIISFTGDNPSALVGMGIGAGDMGISLGTSDTVFLTLDDYHACLEGHIFADPVNPDGFMGMLCFKNGSLVRDRVRGRRSWEEVSELLKETTPGNDGKIGFYFDRDEILPSCSVGVFRFDSNGTPLETFDKRTEMRAILEHQCLAKRLYAERMGFQSHGRLILTGGASNNLDIQQMLADVFHREVFVADTTEAAALGGAVRALRVVTGQQEVDKRDLRVVAHPREDHVKVYNAVISRYEQLQKMIISAQM
ncbi:hypothetical protein QR680_014106 [Steinernema hermaphroditum]|uniref:Xylulose kinase n=1 Tax=Steinernema hermaphroditum TaxID=289476 RepID=A0AA39IAB9_9BILA|nr:hypothetical protein QR680_014106 [Steinernema hermaphroditum]